MQLFSKLIILVILTVNIVFANCGSCGVISKPVEKPTVQKTNVSSLVTYVPEDGNIEGLIITSCGTCNLGARGRGCSLSVKIGEKVYPVEGTSIHDHGDAHGDTGFCSAIRVAWAKGKMKKNVFHAESFVLVGD